MDRALSNTILVTALVVLGVLFTSIMGGYAFARINFPGRDAVFLAYLGSIMIPFIVVIVPAVPVHGVARLDRPPRRRSCGRSCSMPTAPS